MKYLVTGVAGFIGMYVAENLLKQGFQVVGIDNLNSYYRKSLKEHRLKMLEHFKDFRFIQLDLSDRKGMDDLFIKEKFTRVIHLGAQAGVRYSIEAPFDYIDSNLIGMMTILEGCRSVGVEHLVYASSSSVYGMNTKIPFSTEDRVDNPVSLYAATKKSNELMAYTYSHLYKIPTTGLRFFTVYGPWGRPDMAPWLFTEAILSGKPIKVFNNGQMQRDFTYIDDIVQGIIGVQDLIPSEKTTQTPNLDSDNNPLFKVYNIGNNKPVELGYFIECIEEACNKKAEKIMMPMQPGDVPVTYADIDDLQLAIDFSPKTSIEEGVNSFVNWYKNYTC